MPYSVSDLLAASTCEYSAVRAYELKRGWRVPDCGYLSARECALAGCPDHSGNDMMDRLAELGDAHEHAMLQAYLNEFGEWQPGQNSGVFRADEVDAHEREALTQQAFTDGADVLFQVEIRDGQLVGRADFVVKQGHEYAVYDTKLARSARSAAVLQITAYASALRGQGVPMSRYGYLVLGSGEVTRHSVRDAEPVYRRLRARYESLMVSREGQPLASWGAGAGAVDGAAAVDVAVAIAGATGAGVAAASVGTDGGLSTCGRCSECERQIGPARDVLLVMGCTTAHRAKLNQAGVFTVEQLAGLAPATSSEEGGDDEVLRLDRDDIARIGIDINVGTLAKLVAQAQLFIEGERRGEQLYRVVDAKPFKLLRPESAGDIFFDFEGDPLYAEAGSNEWGLEYLFGWCTRELVTGDIGSDAGSHSGSHADSRLGSNAGSGAAHPAGAGAGLEGSHEASGQRDLADSSKIVDASQTAKLSQPADQSQAEKPNHSETPSQHQRPAFYALWAHNRLEEKRAFEQFIDYLQDRVSQYPDMHVYHYAPYETAALKRLALRHGTREEELDQLLRIGLFVDLYAVVRGAMRTSGRSLSIKKLEPFYLDALGQERAGVTNAADSITEYAAAIEKRAAGDTAGFAAQLKQIEEYNRYDCESTFHLLNWVGAIAETNGVQWREATGMEQLVAPEDLVEPEITERVLIADRLREHLDRLTEQWHHAIADAEAHGRPEAPEPEARMITRMAWAGIDYFKRENKQFWWGHFARLSDPVDEWTGSDIFRPTRGEVAEEWHTPPRARTLQRRVRLFGELESGSKLRPGMDVFALYDEPVPLDMATSSNGIRGFGGAEIVEVEDVPGQPGFAVVTVLEKIAKTREPWFEVPMGLGPGAPINTKSIEERLLDFAREVLAALDENPEAPDFGSSARIALLKRAGTALRLDEVTQQRPGMERVDQILASLRSIDSGVVAVQGPPGAGKTFVASHVITTLAKAGWNVGVVAQSHAVVENVLSAVLKRGMMPEAVAKKPAAANKDSEYPFAAIDSKTAQEFFASAATGTVTGGTAWTYSSIDFNPVDGYDLIVIDEAGQYSMANSLAVTHMAKRVLLLGDPQQLPQVSQGTHPEPVNESALAWLVGDNPTIPAERGYFLDQTWRMHPALTEAVSELSYEGKLHSVPITRGRYVEDLEPGLHTLLIDHCGNTVSSEEEATRIVELLTQLQGKKWRETEQDDYRPLTEQDFIVVAPYNAQVQLLRERLDAAGFEDTPVGTVDKFQGQEAAIAIVSLAVSDGADSPRGLEFVRNRNRLNVSISRGKHSAFLVHSEALLDAVESSVQGIEEHGAFIRLSESGVR